MHGGGASTVGNTTSQQKHGHYLTDRGRTVQRKDAHLLTQKHIV